MPTLGSHLILEMYDCPTEVLDDLERVRTVVREAATAAKATVLHETAHRFEPQGVTALALLAESHISVHTWPELGYAAADVFTCGEQAMPERACEHLVRALQAGRHSLQVLARGEQAPTVRPERRPTPGPAATEGGSADVTEQRNVG